jgi:DNA helicase-2/ATP-dependent DNA helicase PcrA
MEYNAVDFDDIIMKTVELLSENREAREYYQNKFKYVLVDEYQDTNHAQFVLTRLLSDKYRNIMVVGDDDQSIYRFRGATVENILQFDKTYPDATVVKLEQNYRSTENILAAANAVIANNDDRHQKKLWCDKGKGEKITLRELNDQNEEGRYIIDRINNAVRNRGKKYSDFAVLYRINELARSLETAFTKSGVPYRILGGQRFYERKEIRDMIAYLSVINTGTDDLRLKRIINEPKRKIGGATVDAVEVIAKETGKPMLEVMRNAGEYTSISKNADKLMAFCRLIDSAREVSTLPSAIIKHIFEASGYYDMLVGEGFEGEGRINSVNELIAGALEYEKRLSETDIEPTLAGYLEEVSLVSDVDKYDENADAVVLMTVHSAKGLEFPTVFIAGMEDGIFPSSMSIGEPMEMSEERRLMYVAITRAKEKLYITYTKNRMMYGRTAYNMLSVFVKEEIPESLLEKEVLRKEPPRSASPYLQAHNAAQRSNYYKEFNRTPDTIKPKAATGGARSYGIEKLAPGTQVSHSAFGRGKILSSKEMGGDVLYEVEFESVGKKKLMATFAKLTKI